MEDLLEPSLLPDSTGAFTIKDTAIDESLRNRGNEKQPWWNQEKQAISNSLWYPEQNLIIPKIDTHSWFQMKGQKRGVLPRPFPSEKYERGTEAGMRRLKISIYPTPEQRKYLDMLFETQRWYYNYVVSIIRQLPYIQEQINQRRPVSFSKLRDEIYRWRYTEEIINGKRIKKVYRHPDGISDTSQLRPWMTIDHTRIFRGAIKLVSNSLSACIANMRAGNITRFNLDYTSRNKVSQTVLFEDDRYPACLKKIEGYYSHGNKNIRANGNKNETINNDVKVSRDMISKAKKIPLSELLEGSSTGFILKKDLLTKRYHLLLPQRIKTEPLQTDATLALDPGIRTFQTGYSPQGDIVEIGSGDQKHLIRMIRRADKLYNKTFLPDTVNRAKVKRARLRLFRRITNKVTDLHWKTINYLIANYKTIILPTFKVSQMVKGRHLGPMAKRILLMYSFYTFKVRLMWRASLYGTNVHIVDESYTSKTCGRCGILNNKLGSSKIFECSACGLQADRDINAARNILVKHYNLL